MGNFMFRVWDKRTKTMAYVCDLYWFEENCVSQINNGRANAANGDYVFMFPAGLNDTNGINIYQGDVLNYKTIRLSPDGGFYLEPESHQPHLARMVDFRDGCFVLVDKKEYVMRIWTGSYDLNSHLKDKKWEVIGNIYENPELLEGG